MSKTLTSDLFQRCRELLELKEKGQHEQRALRALADTYDHEIPYHVRRSMAESETYVEAMQALLATQQPEPRDEVTDSARGAEIAKLTERIAEYEQRLEEASRYMAAQVPSAVERADAARWREYVLREYEVTYLPSMKRKRKKVMDFGTYKESLDADYNGCIELRAIMAAPNGEKR